MGCGTSKLEPDEVAVAAAADSATPPGIGPYHRRIEEIRRRRTFGWMRKDSISTTEFLIEPAAEDEISRSGSLNDGDKVPPPSKEEEAPAAEAVEEREGEKVVAVAEEEAEEEDMRPSCGGELGFGDCPGSPSFRVYYVGSMRSSDEDGSRKIRGKYEGKVDETPKKSKKFLGRRESGDSLNSSEELEYCKLPRRDKGRKLRALAKTPAAVYSRLNVKSCYNNTTTNNNLCPPSPQHSTRRLLCEKNS
ncbi:hypothetical protein QJS10_CPB22g00568 [Acorus calamus]|uniref:Uncharacterized protein n=1 Tax=Acorus calamus TaxID=4465 RepID=A0AAV9C211_ACOCL|nr:hypothetical protein QJS10_CPB22g00568 [Acorus calamus]